MSKSKKQAVVCGRPLDSCLRITDGLVRITADIANFFIKGKAILVSGQDLQDLEKLLKQTEGTGINIYTHGEMLPTHGYPKLKQYVHFYGHYGTAWQNQIKEFPNFPGAILMTTNCIQRPKNDYKDNDYILV